MDPSKHITLLLADDHELVRAGIRVLLDGQPDIKVVAEASDGRSALQLARKHKPMVVLMDVVMPGLNGIEATYAIKRLLPGTKVLALSAYDDWNNVSRMLSAGASGFLLKDMSVADLVRAVRTVAEDHLYLSPEMASDVVKAYVAGPHESKHVKGGFLSRRECEVLQLLAEGHTSKEIAFCLHLSVKTIETHRQRIMDRLDIHTVAELTKDAIRRGLTPLER